jgi:AcrR family transcriptional regulator
MVDGGGGRRRKMAHERREQVIDAAIDVFSRQGFRQGSLRDVASVAGLTVPGLLHYFPTKEQLLMATLERHIEQRLAIQREQGLVAAMRIHLEAGLQRPALIRLFITVAAEATDPDHPAHRYFNDRYRRVFEWAFAGLAADIVAGRTPPTTDPAEAAVRLIALSDGLHLQYLYGPDLNLLRAYDRNTADLVAEPSDVVPAT